MAHVADQVVAWHNRHPLARRIDRQDVQGIGIVTLPFARPAQPHWKTHSRAGGLLALVFPKRVDRRPWAVFSEDALPDIGVARLAGFALRRGWIERPGPAGLPERALQVDQALLAHPQGDSGTPEAPERLDRHLLTAAIDLGPTRPRVVLGRDRGRMPVLGQRLWSLPRIAGVGGAVLLAAVAGVAGLWVSATSRPAPTPGAPAAAVTPAPKPSAASGVPTVGAVVAASTPQGAQTALSASPQPAASEPAHRGADGPQAAAAPTAAPTAGTTAAPTPGSAPTPATAATPTPTPQPTAPGEGRPSEPPGLPQPSSAARAQLSPPAPAAAASPNSAKPPTPIVQRASAPLVPSLKPDLAASARAEAARHPGLPQRSPPASNPPAGQVVPAPPAKESGASDSPAARAPLRFYALVSRPIRSQAEAEAMLKRLRTETERIAHPTAVETSLQRTPDGWRISWWPFTHPRQAENARAAMAARKIELELVEF